MRIARVETPDNEVYLGLVEDGKIAPILREEKGSGQDPLATLLSEDADLAAAETVAPPEELQDCRLLPPLAHPGKILAVGLNYADHAREASMDVPTAPLVFAKTSNTIIGPRDPIRFRWADTREVDYEAELAVVIGRRARRVAVQDALDYVFGYTVANDVSARDLQFSDGQWLRGKSLDTFCPLGPWIVTTDEIHDVQRLAVRCRLNGTTMQDGCTSDMIFEVPFLVSYLSRYITLEPGDVVLTGTPAGVGFSRKPPVYLSDGDEVEVEIEGIGALQNPVVVD